MIKLFLKVFQGSGSSQSLLLLSFQEMLQRISSTVLRDEEYLPATGEDCYKVGVWILLSNIPQTLFGGEKLVKTSFRIELIHKNELSSIHDHAVAGIAREDEDCLVGIAFNEAAKLW